jgi:putative methionine-R-sulfoxide reductase with GAF domain
LKIYLFQQLVKDIADREHAEGLAKKRTADLEAVAQLSTRISAILEPEPLLQAVVNLSKEMYGLYHTQIYLVDHVTGDLNLAAGSGEIGTKMVAEGWKILKDSEYSVVAHAAREKQGIVVNDVGTTTDFLPNPHLPNTRSELAIPMLTSDTLLGILDVQSDTGFFHKKM